MSIRRRILGLTGALTAALALAAGQAGADATGGANHLVLVSTSLDGQTLARGSTQVVTAASPSVTSANIAIATASNCIGCHSTAVAVQVVLVTGNPSLFAPGNVAAATNAACTGCGSFAYARQYFLQTSGPAHLSAEGQQRVAELRQEISDAAASILPSDGLTDPCPVYPVDPLCPSRDELLKEKLDALAAQLEAVVAADVQAVGPDATSAQVQETAGS